MAIDPVLPEIVYALTDAALGPFATTWPYGQQSDVQVWLDLGPGRQRLNPGADYVQNDLAPLISGGTVTLSGALLVAGAWPDGSVLILQRGTAKGQPSSFGEIDGFSPQLMEAALDNIARQVQENAGILTRSLQVDPGESVRQDWPRGSLRAGLFLSADGDGKPIWVPAPGGGGEGDVTSVAGRTGDVVLSVADLNNANLDAYAAKLPSGFIVGTTEPQTLINKTIDATHNTLENIPLAAWDPTILDTDAGLTANSDTRVASQKAVAAYVTTHAAGFHFLTGGSAACATTANIALTGEQTLDGVLTAASRVLVKNQTTATQNGVYVSAAGAWARAADANTGALLANGSVLVKGGTTQGGTTWEATNTTINLGVDAIGYIQTGAGATYSAGAGLTLTGTVFSATFGTTAGTCAQGNDARITGALQAANNLSDLANVRTALTNLGVPTAAGDLGIGSTGLVVSHSTTKTNIAAATTMNLVAAGSRVLYVTGQTTLDANGTPARITSFGPCDPANDKPIMLIFDMFNRIDDGGGGNIVGLPQTFASIQPKTALRMTPIGTNIWHVELTLGTQFVIKDSYWDSQDTLHTQAIKFGSPNNASANCPDFLFNGGDATPKLHTTAIFIGTSLNGQGPQLGFLASGGSPSAMTAEGAGIAGHTFAWVYDGSSFDGTITQQCSANTAGMNHNQNFDYSSRPIQEMFGCFNAPSPTDRSGWWSMGICNVGQVTPVGHTAMLPDGGIVSYGRFGRDSNCPMWNYATGATATYEYPIPWADTITRAISTSTTTGRRGLFPAGWNPLETSSVANHMLLCDDKARFAAVYMAPDPSFQKGVKLGYDQATDSLCFGKVATGTTSYSLRFTPASKLEPITDGGVALGETTNRFSLVAAESTIIKLDTNGTVTQTLAAATGFTADLFYAEAQNTASGSGWNFARYRAEGNTFARINGAGKGFFDGGTATSGAGFGEMLEWADGNPGAEDRSGWAVVLLGDRIARASEHTELPVIGVVSRRLGHVGDAASHSHHGKFQLDSFGRRLTEEVDHVRWEEPTWIDTHEHKTRLVKKTVREPVTETKTVTKTYPHIVERNGQHHQETRTESEVVHVAVTEMKPIFKDGKPVLTPVTRHAPDENGDLQPVLDEAGDPIVDMVQHHEPIPVTREAVHEHWENYDEPCRIPGRPILHCYPADAVPAGLTPPEDAERFAVTRPLLRPGHDPDRDYVSREERQEWDGVSYLGKEFVRKGERIGLGWIKLRDVDDVAEEWLVFPPPPSQPDLVAEITRQVLAQLAAK